MLFRFACCHRTLAESLLLSQVALDRNLTGTMSVHVDKQRVREQKALIAKAELTKERLLLITSVMRQLIGDENFVALLRAEGIADMPKQLMAQLD